MHALGIGISDPSILPVTWSHRQDQAAPFNTSLVSLEVTSRASRGQMVTVARTFSMPAVPVNSLHKAFPAQS